MNRDQFACKFRQYQTHAPEHDCETRERGSPAPARAGGHPLQVVAVGRRGFSLLVDGMPMFLAFSDHPAFAGAAEEQLRHIQRPQPNRLYWPELGIRLDINEIRARWSPPARTAPARDPASQGLE